MATPPPLPPGRPGNEAVNDDGNAQGGRPQHQSGHGSYFRSSHLRQHVDGIGRVWLVQGDSLFDEVRAAGVDVYVTSDLRHHPVTDAIEQARYEASMRAADIELGRGDATVRPMFVNTPHSAIESIWFQYAMGDVPRAVSEATGDIPTVRWISMNTDPWNLVLPSCGQER